MPPPALPSVACWIITLVLAGRLLGNNAVAEALERRPLFDPEELRLWSAAECKAQVSTTVTRDAPASLHWQITVDYETGEPQYPIGWPRISRSFPAGPLRDWSEWDYLHCWVFVATPREALPAVPAGLGLHTPDRASAYQRTLTELKAREWVEIKIPIAQIPRHHDVRQIQFHIAELNYRDGDRLDFYLSDLALLRYAAPTILDFAAESAVVFSDARQLPLRLHLAGVAPDARVPVTLELRRSGHASLRRELTATRGVQHLALDLEPAALTPGDWEIRIELAGQTSASTARVRVVASPWP